MKNLPLILLIILALPFSSFSQINSADILAGEKMTMSSNVLNYNP
jgi:hypothetical protein